MRVTVADGRVAAVDGDPENPDSRGFLCVRGRAAVEIRDNPNRLHTPLRRVGPRGTNAWEAISWDSAMSEIAARIATVPRDRSGIWFGHGSGVNGANRPLLMRFGHLSGMQVWNPAMVCWALGGYGLGLTGVLECNTKEDMADHSRTIVLWGANLASQPTTAPHLVVARRRGARVIVIDVRRSEAARHADEVLLIKPGSDAALALALAQVIVAEGLHDRAFIAAHTLGFAEFEQHLAAHTPEWAAPITGLEPEAIRRLARTYASAVPAMIVLGGSSIFKHRQGWEPARAIACLPALTGQLGRPGTGFTFGYGSINGVGNPRLDLPVPQLNTGRNPTGLYIPVARVTDMLETPGGVCEYNGRAITYPDTRMIYWAGGNPFHHHQDLNRLLRAWARAETIVVHEPWWTTLARHADIVLPATTTLERNDIGASSRDRHVMAM
ncbi:MAG: molybdopterin-dependent oxidoreductase, partial [Oscillochloris sp.]|nr:molybdopterin-dependent oxidoreductase [Oscillochloris sp.]